MFFKRLPGIILRILLFFFVISYLILPHKPVLAQSAAPFLTLPFNDSKVELIQGWTYNFKANLHPDGTYVHNGIDYIKKGSAGKWVEFDVVAAASGKAMQGFSPGLGNYVLIRHNEKDAAGGNYFTLYAHLGSVEDFIEKRPGQDPDDFNNWSNVERSQIIGKAGDSESPGLLHLHFEVKTYIGPASANYFRKWNWIDPYGIYKTKEHYPIKNSDHLCITNQCLWLIKPGNPSPINGLLPAPQLVMPMDKVNITGKTVSFQWKAVTGATHYKFLLTKADDGKILINRNIGNYTSYAQSGFPDDGAEYNWQVTAGNNNTNWGLSSEVRAFTVGTKGGTLPGQPIAKLQPPILSFPVNKSFTPGSEISFQWQPVQGAVSYWLGIYNLSSHKIISNKSVGNVTAFIQDGFSNDGSRYVWAVRVRNSAGLSRFSEIRTFVNEQSKAPTPVKPDPVSPEKEIPLPVAPVQPEPLPIEEPYPVEPAPEPPSPGSVALPDISAGRSHSLALKRDGTVWAWGYNGLYGLIGDGTTTTRFSPVRVSSLSNIVEISAGGDHSLALKSDGTVWAWGRNQYGQLGNNTTEESRVPVQVISLSNVVKISAGGSHSLALRSDGTIWAWGNNSSGRLGDGTTKGRLVPVKVSSLNGVVAISAGGSHSLALMSDGTVWAWGNNHLGRLGDGTTFDRNEPVPVVDLMYATEISAGSHHSIALKSDGTVWAWGDATWGQIGDGSNTSSRKTPVQVNDLNNSYGISGGSMHSIAISSNLNVWAWGRNYSGQLGDGTTNDARSPIVTKNLSNIHRISAGSEFTLALKSDGTVWGWGWNSSGQLGNGTNEKQLVPVQIPGFNLEKP